MVFAVSYMVECIDFRLFNSDTFFPINYVFAINDQTAFGGISNE